ncbi:MAG: diacylglycerol kinase family lipid kinase [Deltaproteobacteria bacterium]|nr:diacylglycerol kinase family lipid kinase [Deltaproteobacteria bacterium]
MKPILIANPGAAGGRVGREIASFERAVADRFGPCEVRLSQRPGGVEHLVRKAADEGAELIGLVGGDGTIGEAVNGVLGGDREVPEGLELVFLPAGTGGDFARVIGMAEWIPDNGLSNCSPKKIDVGRAEIRGHDGEPVTRLFANIASTGASAAIAEGVNQTSKKLGRFGFAVGALKGLAAWRNRRIRLRVDDTVDREVDFNSVAVANGRCFGGGMKIAPNARLDDGLLDVITIEPLGPTRFVTQGRKLYKGTHLDLPEITEDRGCEVRIEAIDDGSEPIPVEVDGEHPGFLPLCATILPEALTLIAPWGRADGAC